MTAGDIYTIAGTGSQGVAADGTPALSAALTPWDQAVDAAGNLIFYDSGVNKIRVIPATTGIYYGIHTTADHVYSIVGGGTGSLGDADRAGRPRSTSSRARSKRPGPGLYRPGQ